MDSQDNGRRNAVEDLLDGFVDERFEVTTPFTEESRKPFGYWKDWNNLVAEAQNLIETHGTIPRRSDLNPSFYTAVQYHGGIKKLRRFLGLEDIRVDEGHWKEWGNVKVKLEKIITKLGHFPTQDELSKLGETSVLLGITKYHDGLWETAKKMGHTPSQHKRGHWKEWGNIEKAVIDLTAKLGHFPSYDEIGENVPGIIKGLEYRKITYNEFRASKGIELSRKEAGYWENEDNIISEVRTLMEKHNLANIDSVTLENLGATTLRGAISEKFGFNKLRDKLGLENLVEEPGTWQDLEFTKQKVRQIMEEHNLERMPSAKKFSELNYANVAAAIENYHGGFTAFRKILGEKKLRTPNDSWNKLEYVVERVKLFITENNLIEFPTYTQLQQLGGGSIIAAAASYHGGFDKVKEGVAPFLDGEEFKAKREAKRLELIVSHSKKPIGFWSERRNKVDALRLIIEERKLNRFPTYDELRAWGYKGLLSAIQYQRGGLNDLAEDVGLSQQRSWEDKDEIFTVIRKVIAEKGLTTLPSDRELKACGYEGIMRDLKKIHKISILDLSRELAYPAPKNSRNTFTNLEYVVSRMKAVMEENGLTIIPSQKELSRLGHSSLSSAIIKYHGGFSKLRENFGEETRRTENGAWKSLDYAVGEARNIMTENTWEVLPAIDKLVKLGYSSLTNAVTKYHGGMHEFRKQLGEKVERVKVRGWKDREFVIQEVEKVKQEHKIDTFPTSHQLRKWGYAMLNVAICEYHGGYIAFRKSLGGEDAMRAPNTWKNLDFVLATAKKVMEREGLAKLPCSSKLRTYSDGSNISTAIVKYHGGFTEFRTKLSEYLGKPNSKEQTESLLGVWANE